MAKSYNENIIDVLKQVKGLISEQMNTPEVPIASSAPMGQIPTRKPTKVNFDKNSDQPYSVIFSERGFSIDNTRMSFEELETAISKNYNITLDGGNGLTLDAVKMQKILKYKDLY